MAIEYETTTQLIVRESGTSTVIYDKRDFTDEDWEALKKSAGPKIASETRVRALKRVRR